MFPKLHRKDSASLKLAPLIMPALRSGKTNHTIKNQTFGRLDVSSTNLFASRYHLKGKIWRLFTKRLPGVSTPESHLSTQVS